MKKQFPILVVYVMAAIALPVTAPAARRDCIPPFGYIETCGAVCGVPGSCKLADPSKYCLVTEDRWGCHDGSDDPCCGSEPGF